jgi:ribosome-binding factor A
MAQGERTLRVAEMIQREVASILLTESRDAELRSVTVTAVRVSPDLGYARVLYTTGTADRKTVERKLGRLLPMIQRRVGEAVRLRYVPRLSFQWDEGMVESFHVLEILDEIGAKRGDAAADPPAEAPDEEGGDPE